MKSITAGEQASWQLPDIVEGDYSLQSIVVQPAGELADLVSFSQNDRTIFFSDDESSNSLVGKLLAILIELKDEEGNFSSYNQLVMIIAPPEEEIADDQEEQEEQEEQDEQENNSIIDSDQ